MKKPMIISVFVVTLLGVYGSTSELPLLFYTVGQAENELIDREQSDGPLTVEQFAKLQTAFPELEMDPEQNNWILDRAFFDMTAIDTTLVMWVQIELDGLQSDGGAVIMRATIDVVTDPKYKERAEEIKRRSFTQTDLEAYGLIVNALRTSKSVAELFPAVDYIELQFFTWSFQYDARLKTRTLQEEKGGVFSQTTSKARNMIVIDVMKTIILFGTDSTSDVFDLAPTSD